MTYTGTFPKLLLANVKEAVGKRVLVSGQRNALELMTIQIDSIEIFPEESELPTLEEMIGLFEEMSLATPSMNFCREGNIVTCKIKIEENNDKNQT